MAAKFLKTSQPSLSTQIKTLEFNLDKSLFMKKGKYLELTSEGIKIFNICSKMFEVYEELEDYLRGPASGIEEINLGFCNEIYRPFTTNIVGQILKKYKLEERPKVKLSSSSNEQLVENLKLKKLNFIVTNNLPNDPDLKILKSFSMPVALVGRKDFIQQLKIQNLKTIDPILKKASAYLCLPSDPLKLRMETNHFYLKNKQKYNVFFESDILASVVRAAIDGIGLCLIPLPYIKKELQNQSLEILPKMASLWKHQLYVLARNERSEGQFSKKLISELELSL